MRFDLAAKRSTTRMTFSLQYAHVQDHHIVYVGYTTSWTMHHILDTAHVFARTLMPPRYMHPSVYKTTFANNANTQED